MSSSFEDNFKGVSPRETVETPTRNDFAPQPLTPKSKEKNDLVQDTFYHTKFSFHGRNISIDVKDICTTTDY